MNPLLIEWTQKQLNIPLSAEFNLSDGTIYMGLLKLVYVDLPSLSKESKLIFKIQNLEVIKHYCKRFGVPFFYNIPELAGSSDNSSQVQMQLLQDIILYIQNQPNCRLKGRVALQQTGAPIDSRNKENMPLNIQPEIPPTPYPQVMMQTPIKVNYANQDPYNQIVQQSARSIHQSMQRNIEEPNLQQMNYPTIHHASQMKDSYASQIKEYHASQMKEQVNQQYSQPIPCYPPIHHASQMKEQYASQMKEKVNQPYSQMKEQENLQYFQPNQCYPSIHQASQMKEQVNQQYSQMKEQVNQQQIVGGQDDGVRFLTQFQRNTGEPNAFIQRTGQKYPSSQYFASQESIFSEQRSASKSQAIDLEYIAEMINKKVDSMNCTQKFLPLLSEANDRAQQYHPLLYCFIIDILCTEEDTQFIRMRWHLVQEYNIPQEYRQPFSYGQRINFYN